eukprot:m.24834 g.24834  ORF g.24834 m.24834 type:complete len:418 (+) comp13471_c0_seq1:386-1639(+)
MERFEFTIGEDSIPFFLGKDCFADICDEIIKIGRARRFDKIFIGCDQNVRRLHVDKFAAALKAKDIPFDVCETKSGEPNKSITSLDFILEFMLTHGCSRNSIIIPFGGGVVGNMFGLAAALLFRGIRFIHVPTTFLSAHDSVTSKKQAINHCGLKNIVGTYYVPTAIMVNVSIFETLTTDNIRSGSGELTKNAVLFGGEHMSVLEPILTRHCGDLRYTADEMLQLMRMGIKAKGSLLRDDPKERTTAIIFEYGHTVGHALELTYGISHGCAVALGMLAASYMSNKLGLMTDEDRKAHDDLVKKLGVTLPRAPTADLQNKVFKRVQGDNKRGYIPYREGFYPLILAKQIGVMHKPNAYYLEYVPEKIVVDAIKYVTTTQYVEPVDQATSKISRPLYLSQFSSLNLARDMIVNALNVAF